MRICLLSPYPELREGVGRYTQALLSALQNLEGIFPVAVPFHSSGKPTMVEEFLGIGKALRVFKQIVKCHPDILHIQYTSSTYPKSGLILLLQMLRLMPTRLVVTQHEFVRESRPIKIRTLFEKIVCHGADLLIVLTRYSLDAARVGLTPRRTKIIPHGLTLHKPVAKDEARTMLGIPKDAKILLAFGYVSPHKGLEYAIRAVKHVVKSLPLAHLIIAGGPHPLSRDDTYMGALKHLAVEEGDSHHVTFTGYVPDRLVDYYLDSADIMLLPYVGVTQSGVVYMAVAHSVPVVTSSLGGFREELERNEIGVLVPPCDASSLAEAIVNLLSDPERLERYSRNEARLSRELSWEVIARRHLEAYNELIDTRPECDREGAA